MSHFVILSALKLSPRVLKYEIYDLYYIPNVLIGFKQYNKKVTSTTTSMKEVFKQRF